MKVGLNPSILSLQISMEKLKKKKKLYLLKMVMHNNMSIQDSAHKSHKKVDKGRNLRVTTTKNPSCVYSVCFQLIVAVAPATLQTLKYHRKRLPPSCHKFLPRCVILPTTSFVSCRKNIHSLCCFYM